MNLFFLREGHNFTLYSLEMADSVTGFITALERDDPAEHARIMRRLEQLAEHGPSRKKNEFNILDDGLYEAKSKGGGRIIFFYDTGKIVICAAGFRKKSKRTPKNVLKKAQARKKAYQKQKASGRGFTILVSESMDKPRRIP